MTYAQKNKDEKGKKHLKKCNKKELKNDDNNNNNNNNNNK